MATYLELQTLFNDNDLTLRTRAATVIAAANLLANTPTANETEFAAKVLASPAGISKQVLMYVLASNKSATISQIQDSTDTTIQTNVDEVIPLLVNALAGV